MSKSELLQSETVRRLMTLALNIHNSNSNDKETWEAAIADLESIKEDIVKSMHIYGGNLTKHEEILIIKMYAVDRKSMSEIQETLNIGKATVSRTLKEYGVLPRNTRPKRIADKEIEVIRERIAYGELIQDIAKERGVTPSAITHLLERR